MDTNTEKGFLVCACCNPPLLADFYNPWYTIEVPNDTPLLEGKNGWGLTVKYINPDVLERGGMKWDGRVWLTPEGKLPQRYSLIDKIFIVPKITQKYPNLIELFARYSDQFPQAFIAIRFIFKKIAWAEVIGAIDCKIREHLQHHIGNMISYVEFTSLPNFSENLIVKDFIKDVRQFLEM